MNNLALLVTVVLLTSNLLLWVSSTFLNNWSYKVPPSYNIIWRLILITLRLIKFVFYNFVYWAFMIIHDDLMSNLLFFLVRQGWNRIAIQPFHLVNHWWSPVDNRFVRAGLQLIDIWQVVKMLKLSLYLLRILFLFRFFRAVCSGANHIVIWVSWTFNGVLWFFFYTVLLDSGS